MIGTPHVFLGTAPNRYDITCLVDEVNMRHGRGDTTSQPTASTATVEISLDTDDEAFPPGLEVGAALEVHVVVGGTDSTRFVGRVTDTSVGWDDAGEDTPNRPVLQVIATGPLADMGRRVVGDAPFPQETDGARVDRILALAGVPTNAALTDPGTLQILARDIDAQPALDLAYSVADSSSGLMWETRAGLVLYADAEHRRGVLASMTLDSCDVLVTPVWQRNLDGLLNEATVTYGTAPEGAQRPTYTATNAASQTKFGRYEVTRTTELADQANAQALALLLTTRGGRPEWNLTALPVDVVSLTQAETIALLGLDMHSLIELIGMPAFDGLPTATSLWVEGWSESLRAGEHGLILTVSGYCRTVPPPHWDDVPVAVTWNTVGTLSWDDASCMGPLPIRGDRWDDQPASTRWDQLTPGQTWDTFTGDTVPAGG
jgi:hypothetical protein